MNTEERERRELTEIIKADMKAKVIEAVKGASIARGDRALIIKRIEELSDE